MSSVMRGFIVWHDHKPQLDNQTCSKI